MDNIALKAFELGKDGYCNYCNNFFLEEKRLNINNENLNNEKLSQLIALVKTSGAKKRYDCIIGLSGGVDSAYLAYWAWKNGLRPLAVHFDNGWNSELAVHNIENIIRITGFDLYTYVINWDEFRDLQRAYFKAGVIDIEVPTDHMIFATLFKVAAKNKIKYLLSGTNHQTEGIMPKEWVFDKTDLINLKDIHKKFGELKLKTYPKLGYLHRFYFQKIKGIQFLEPLQLQRYNKSLAKSTIVREFGWRDYGSKHYESTFTKFYQGHVLPLKFKVDKRKAHLSTLICNGEVERQIAREDLNVPPIAASELRELYNYSIKKLGFTDEEFQLMMKEEPVPHRVYKTEGNPGFADKIFLAIIWRINKYLF
ncbi:MAG: ExsB family protein [Chitinophagaceae bacterium]|nr:ExsB family protein [Chitinophagaceae bacterium]